MALAVVQDVIDLGGLVPELFLFVDPLTNQASLAARVTDAIEDSDAWMQVYLGDNYGGTTAAETRIQTVAQRYLAMAFLEPTLRAFKVRGLQYPLVSEEGTSYEDLLEKDWEGMAKSLLNKWVTTELEIAGQKENFALPYFAATDSPDPLVTDDEDVQMRDIADTARAEPEVVFPTVTI